MAGFSAGLRLVALALVLTLAGLAAGAAVDGWRGAGRAAADADAALAARWATASRAITALPAERRTVDRIREILRLFDGDPAVTATLVAADGTRRDRSTPPRRGHPAPRWFAALLAPAPRSMRFEIAGIGALVLVTDMGEAVDRLWSDVLADAAVIAALGLAGTLAGLLALTRVRRTLDRVAASLDRLAAGEDPLPLARPAPAVVAPLVAAFDRAAARIADGRARAARIAAQHAEAEDEERRALARDLHDEIGPLLFAADVDAAAVERLVGEPAGAARDGEIAARAGALRAALAATRREVRALLGQLRPGPSLKIGLREALDGVVAFFAERRPEVRFSVDAPDEGFGGTIDGALAAIVREAVANALKHGTPRAVSVEVGLRDGRIRLKVADDGGGFAPTRGAGYGIVGMGERARALGGRLAVESRLDLSGVVVSAVIPPPGRTRPDALESEP